MTIRHGTGTEGRLVTRIGRLYRAAHHLARLSRKVPGTVPESVPGSVPEQMGYRVAATARRMRIAIGGTRSSVS